MKNLVPDFVKRNFAKGIKSGKTECFVIMADITGFSGTTEKCLQKGKKGCEKLNEILSSAFIPAINAVYDNGGFIGAFAGDGFTAIFEKSDCVIPDVFNASTRISEVFVSDGEIKLNYKIGLSVGFSTWKIIETPYQNSFIFEGEAIERAAYFKSKASPGEIITDFRISADEGSDEYKTKSENNTGVKKRPVQTRKAPIKNRGKKANYDERFWVNPAVISARDLAEFRDIVSCFICFEKSGNPAYGLHKTIELSYEHGGYLNKIDFGDKGGIVLVVFGAPLEIENKFSKAADFALAIRKIKRFEVKTGISYGKAFCGFIGNEKRSEYTVLGSAVNISSRIAEKASGHEIICDETFSLKITGSHNLYPLGEEYLRGIKDKISLFGLGSKKSGYKSKIISRVEFVGRKMELERLVELSEKVKSEIKSMTVLVSGESGTGKSRLIEEFNAELGKTKFDVLKIECDDILKKPFSPLINFLKEYFGYSDTDSEFLNKVRFEDTLQRKVKKIAHSGDTGLSEKISGASECLSMLLGIASKGSGFESLDAKTKYELCFGAIKNVLLAECSDKPTALEIFQASDIDKDSLDIILSLAKSLKNLPSIIIFESRDPSLEVSLLKTDITDHISIRLEKLSKSESESLFKNYVKISETKQHSELSDMHFDEEIYSISEGNPLYIENIAGHVLREGFSADSDAMKKILSEPLNLKELILSRFDRFGKDLKEAVRVASILGNSFSEEIFCEVFGEFYPELDSKNCLNDGVAQNVFKKTPEGYGFSSALTREVIYSVQMNPFLGKIHFSAAEFLKNRRQREKLSYEDIAEHYRASESFDIAADYYLRASKAFFDIFLNERALSCLEKAEKILPPGSFSQFFEIYYIKTSIYRLIGKWSQAKKCVQKCLETAQRSKLPEKYCLALDMLASLERNSGNLTKAMNHAKRGIRIANSTGDVKLTALLESSLGNTCYRKGDYEEAINHYSKSISSIKGDKTAEAKILVNMANIKAENGNLEQSLRLYLRALKLSRFVKDIKTESVVLLNLGTIYLSLQNSEKAMKSFNESLRIKESYQDKDGIAILKSNIGHIHEEKGNFETALKCYEESAELAGEIGDKRSHAIALCNKASVFSKLKEFKKAKDLYVKAVKLSKMSGSKYNLCFYLYSLADLYFELGDFEKSRISLDEALKSASEVKRTSVIESCDVLGLALDFKTGKSPDAALAKLTRKSEKAKDAESKAFISYLLFNLTKEKLHARVALEQYSSLLDKTPKYENKVRKDELESFIVRYCSHSNQEDK